MTVLRVTTSLKQFKKNNFFSTLKKNFGFTPAYL